MYFDTDTDKDRDGLFEKGVAKNAFNSEKNKLSCQRDLIKSFRFQDIHCFSSKSC